MDINEVETIGAAIIILQSHNYRPEAEALRSVLVQEFAKVAEALKEE